jgi:hypothetical protein
LVFKRILLGTDKKSQAKQEAQERKTSKTIEDVGAGLVDIRVEDKQLAEWDFISWDELDAETDSNNGTPKAGEQTGVAAALGGIARLTRGLENVLDQSAMQAFSWTITRLQGAISEKNWTMAKFLWNYRIVKYYALLGTLVPHKNTPDVVLMAIPTKPGGNVEPQQLIEKS